MRRVILAVAYGVICAACSSSPKTAEVGEPAPVPAPAYVLTEAGQSGLPAQSLEPGECGLFLWNRTNSTTFVFFQRAGDATARFFGEAEVEVANVSNDGVLFGEFFTMTNWRLPDGRALSLSVVPGEDIEGGQRIPNGVISTREEGGWEVKIPVAGVTACKIK